jgi:hypothetical protein
MDPLFSLALFLQRQTRKQGQLVMETHLNPEAPVEEKKERYLTNGDMVEGRWFELPIRDGITGETLWLRLSAKELWDMLNKMGRE